MIIKKMKNSRYCIVSFRSTILVQVLCDRNKKKETKKMYVSKVNIYHDKLYEDKKNTTKQSRVCADKRKKEV